MPWTGNKLYFSSRLFGLEERVSYIESNLCFSELSCALILVLKTSPSLDA